MEEKKRKYKIILKDLEEEFYRLDHIQQEKFALEQIKLWLGKLNQIKTNLPDTKSIDSAFESD